MRRARGVFLAAVWGLSVLACAAQASPRPALVDAVYNGLGGGAPFYGSVTVGWQFVPQHDMLVTDLGFFDIGSVGLNTFHEVGIWDGDQRLLVSATVPAGTAAPLLGEFRYVAIEPLLLQAGNAYVIGATANVPTSQPAAYVPDGYPSDTIEMNPQHIVFDPWVSLTLADLYISDPQGSVYAPLAYPFEHRPTAPLIDFNTGQPIGTIYPYHFAADFRFEAAPEPSTLAILAIGYLALRVRRGNKRRVLLRGFVGSSVPSAIGVFWDCASERSSP